MNSLRVFDMQNSTSLLSIIKNLEIKIFKLKNFFSSNNEFEEQKGKLLYYKKLTRKKGIKKFLERVGKIIHSVIPTILRGNEIMFK